MRSVTQIWLGINEYADGYVNKFSLSYSYNGNEWFGVKDPNTNQIKVNAFLSWNWNFTEEYKKLHSVRTDLDIKVGVLQLFQNFYKNSS